ncbi:MAG: M23 family metallopeptidase [Candidatus Pseudobacter hemicellulosilyticus]|uniref:M23 family metallopeptidase n=1 Tax=Candidatus Pseudobacter hemicellulosilyticus TaxID=3121375 RepID=A0AAJ6BGJ5_9BACT|nr:MAG: M23 family metallopeptidase [Pseudobacter sp.]
MRLSTTTRRKPLFLLILTALLLCAGLCWYLVSRQADYYRNPLDIPLRLSANFGELREDHFHMGLDIRTRGQENLPVVAAAGGYVSRIIIEEERYGNALLIAHPNQTTTLYAHLNGFSDSLQAFIRSRQYRQEQWEQDIRLPPDRFPVSKGQFIGWSGNTGGSQGPHLHFELLDTKTGRNLDPLQTGLTGWDYTAPVITGLYWYNRGVSTYQEGGHYIPIRKKGEDTYQSEAAVVLVNSPLISLGIRAGDKHPEAQPLLGIKGAEVMVDGKTIHQHSLESFSAIDSRYINACIDYSRRAERDQFVQHLSTLPGNRMPGFEPNDGLIDLSDKKEHTLSIIVRDAGGNSARFEGRIRYTGKAVRRDKPSAPLLAPGKAVTLRRPFAEVRFSKLAFYDSVPFRLTASPSSHPLQASPRILLHGPGVPVHDSFLVQLPSTLPASHPLRHKIVLQLESGRHRLLVKPQWQGNRATARLDRLGTVQLLLDTMAPRIGQPQWKPVSTPKGREQVLYIECKDNLGRVASLRALLNGRWLLLERKDNCFMYRPDRYAAKGKGQLLLTATDVAGNSSSLRWEWRRE